MRALPFIFLLVLSFTLHSQSLEGTEYFFLGTQDVFYENPDNWYPEYPGSKIGFGNKVVVQSDMYFQGFNLIVEGELEIELGVVINSPANSIFIKQLGEVNNYGNLVIYSVINYGKFTNNVSSHLDLKTYVAKPSGVTNNFMSASFTVNRDIINDGIFNNYSYCEVGQNFKNSRVFNQINASELLVSGTYMEYSGSQLNHSDESIARIRSTIENMDKPDGISEPGSSSVQPDGQK